MIVLRSLAIVLALAATAAAQGLTLTARSYQRLNTSAVVIYDDVILVGKESQQIESTPVCAVIVETPAGADVIVSVSQFWSGSRTTTPYEIVQDAPTGDGRRQIVYLIDTPGAHWFDAVSVDFATKKLDRREVEITVEGDTPAPPTPPDPKPPTPPEPTPPPLPDGPFDSLAKRVQVYAAKLTDAQRTQIASTCATAAKKMWDYEFRQQSQAREYVAKNWPPCDDAPCRALFDFINADAASRKIYTWNDAISYYEQIAKGVRAGK